MIQDTGISEQTPRPADNQSNNSLANLLNEGSSGGENTGEKYAQIINLADGTTLRSAAAESIQANYMGGKPNWEHPDAVQLLRVSDIKQHPLNPRHYVSRVEMYSLLESIRQTGIHNPITVCRSGEDGNVCILSGHRRLWATTSLNYDLIPCRLDPRRNLTRSEQIAELIRANEGQEKIAPVDRARAILTLITSETPHLSQTEAARRLSIAPPEVSKLLGLLCLPESIQELINKGSLNLALATLLVRRFQATEGERQDIFESLAQTAVEEKWSAAQLQKRLANHKLGGKQTPHVNNHGKGRHEPLRGTDASKPTVSQIRVLNGVSVRISSSAVNVTDPANLAKFLHEAIQKVPVDIRDPQADYRPPMSPVVKVSPQMEEPAEDRRSSSAIISPSDQGEYNDDVGSAPDTHQSANTDNYESIGGTDTKKSVALHMTTVNFNNETLTSAAADSLATVFTDGYPDWTKPDTVQLIRISALIPHPNNPRVMVSRESINNLEEAIRGAGIHTPILIGRSKDSVQQAVIMGGHRRTYVANSLKFDLVPCRLDPRKDLSISQQLEILARDNEGQLKPQPVDTAIIYQKLLDALREEQGQVSIASACQLVGVAEHAMRNSLLLLKLPPTVQRFINDGDLSEAHGRALAAHVASPEAITSWATKAISGNMTAAVLAKALSKSKPDLGALQGQASPKPKSSFVVGPDKRVHVEIIGAGETADGKDLVKALTTAMERTDKFEDVSVEAPEAQLIATESIKPLFSKANKNTLQKIASALGKYAQASEDGEDVLVSELVMQALKRPFTNHELKKAGLTNHDLTQPLAYRWNGFPNGAKDSDKTPLWAVIALWVGNLETIARMQGSVRFISGDMLDKNMIDSVEYNGAKPVKLTAEIRARLTRIEPVLDTKFIPVLKAHADAEEFRKKIESGSSILGSELKQLGFEITPTFFQRYNNWRTDKSKQPIRWSQEDIRYDLSDLYDYMVNSVVAVLQLSGMGLRGSVAEDKIRHSRIPYSGKSGQKRFTVSEVYEFVARQLGILNREISREIDE